MIVYNTNAAITGGSGVGFYFWNGASWVKVVTGTTATLTDGKIWIGDASNNPVEQSISGDVLISNTGATTIQDNAVDGTDITITGESNGSLMYFNGTDWVNVAPGTSGQILRSNGASAPTWQNTTIGTKAQNGVNISNITPNATASDPYVELGGTLIRPTTISGLTATNTMNFTGTGINAFSVDGTTFSIDATNNRVGIVTTTPAYPLDVNGDMRAAVHRTTLGNGNVFQIGDDAWLSDVNAANTAAIIGSSNAAVGALQLSNNTNSYIYGTGGNIGIKTTALTQDVNIGGRLYISNGVIQSGGGAAITGTSDLGLYSTTNGAWIRIVSNSAPIRFFVDGGTTNTGSDVSVSIEGSGILEARKGFRSYKNYKIFQRFRYNSSITDNLGTWDFCALSASTYYMDYTSDFDMDIQCNVYPSETGISTSDNSDFNVSFNKAYNARPTWYLYTENLDGGQRLTCAAICINFE